MAKGAIYVRVSTTAQAAPDRSSMDAQLEECKALAARQGFHVDEAAVFHDVMSGRRDDRPGFNELVRTCRSGGIRRVFVWSVDRLGRDLYTSIKAVRDLRQSGVDVFTAKEGDLNNELVLSVLAGVASRELERIRERTLPAKLRKRSAGQFVSGIEPFGYVKRPDKTLARCPIEAPVVREIFTCSIAGMGRTQIARRLNSKGIPPSEAVVRDKQGKRRRIRIRNHNREQPLSQWLDEQGLTLVRWPEWQSRTVARVLENTAAYGELLTSGKHSAGERIILAISDGPIVSRAEFEASQRAMQARRRVGRRPSVPWLLSGKITCGACGSRYVHFESHGTHYYACNARKSGKSCKGPYIRAEVAHRKVLSELSSYLYSALGQPGQLAELLTRQSKLNLIEIRDAIREAESRLASAYNSWEKAQLKVSQALDAGVQLSSVPALVRSVNEARDGHQRIEGEVAALRDQELSVQAGLTASAAEVTEIAGRILQSLMLAPADDEPVADLEAVIRELVSGVNVESRDELAVAIRQEPAALIQVFRTLATDSLTDLRQETRLNEAVAREAARTAPQGQGGYRD